MAKIKPLVPFFTIILVFALICSASEGSYKRGFSAEMNGEYRKALKYYYQYLDDNPDIKTMMRVSDIHNKLKEYGKSEEILKKAIEIENGTPELYYRLAQVESAQNNPEDALKAIEKALSFEPENEKYLKSAVTYANWSSNPELASKYLDILENTGNLDESDKLIRARTLNWRGKSDKSVKVYQNYLANNEDDSDAWIEYIKAQAWRGNFHRSIKAHKTYKDKFGKNNNYLETAALVYALAGEYDESLNIVEKIEEENVSFEVRYAEILSLHHSNQKKSAVKRLNSLKRDFTGRKEAGDLEKLVRTPLRSRIAVEVNHNEDSDGIERKKYSFGGRHFLNSGLSLYLFAYETELDTEEDSPFQSVYDDQNSITEGFLGIDWQINRYFNLDLKGGYGEILNHSDFFYSGKANFDINDSFSITLSNGRKYYDVSPAALDFNLREDYSRASISISPGQRFYVNANARHSELTDGNDYQQYRLSPGFAVIRTSDFNFDIGVTGFHLEFSKDLNNGYYDPLEYKKYSLNLYTYFKLTENDGIGIVISPGYLKDNNMSGYESGIDISLEGTFGTFRNWMLTARAGYFENDRFVSGSYRSNSFGLSLTRRF